MSAARHPRRGSRATCGAQPGAKRRENLIASAGFTKFFDLLHHAAARSAYLHGMASDKELADFLAGVERRAFKQAAYAVRDDDASLDIAGRDDQACGEVRRPAGGRVAAAFSADPQNAIHDWFRRQKVRNTWVTLFSSLNSSDDDDFDPLETLESADDNAGVESSEHRLERAGSGPDRRRNPEASGASTGSVPDALLGRYGCRRDCRRNGVLEGSVKTHCSRATHTLAHALKAKGITL